jgi:Zn-finger nucleic acid-binding protein
MLARDMAHDDRLDCPACGADLEPRGARLFCDSCRGVLVTRDELREMLRSIHPNDKRALEQQLVPIAGGSRACPRCGVRMDAFSINHIPIDQCFAHGFWFDRDELSKVLQGKTSPEELAAAYQLRQVIANQFEYGALGSFLEQLYRWLRARRRRTAAPPRDEP